jgi:UDP-glucose 4-epimerase
VVFYPFNNIVTDSGMTPGVPPAIPGFSGERCLVTGGCGFIGSNLVKALVASGADVTVIDNLSTGKRGHLPVVGQVTLIEADIRTIEWPKLLAGTAYVFHLAAQVGNVKSIEFPESDAATNVLGSVRLYAACRGAGIRKLVYASSSAIFGEADVIPIVESHPQRPASFYALSKQTGEQYALLAQQLWAVPTVCVRFFNAYGLPMEKSEYSGVINIFMDRLAQSLPLTIYGDGGQIRDFVYVEDICQAILRGALQGAPGAVYNIGTGVASTISDLAEALISITGVQSRIEHAPERLGEVRSSLADIRRASQELGYHPHYTLRRGLQAIWEAVSVVPQ